MGGKLTELRIRKMNKLLKDFYEKFQKILKRLLRNKIDLSKNVHSFYPVSNNKPVHFYQKCQILTRFQY